MAFEVLRTPQVRRAVEQQMSRAEQAGYEAARDELRGRGCLAGGYKLASTDGGNYPLCARHLAYTWRTRQATVLRGRRLTTPDEQGAPRLARHARLNGRCLCVNWTLDVTLESGLSAYWRL
jgi:hypothetical protein